MRISTTKVFTECSLGGLQCDLPRLGEPDRLAWLAKLRYQLQLYIHRYNLQQIYDWTLQILQVSLTCKPPLLSLDLDLEGLLSLLLTLLLSLDLDLEGALPL